MARIRPPTSNDAPAVTAVFPPLRQLRERHGMSQLELAERSGITRQSLYAIEQGKAQPSVGVAVRIARALGTTVEQLFDEENVLVEAFTTSMAVVPGTRVMLGWNRDGHVALPLDARSSIDSHRAGDGVVRKRDGRRVEVELMYDREVPPHTLLVAGCAPALSVLAERLSTRGNRVVFLQAASLAALELLRGDQVQVAGVHLVDAATGEANVPFVTRHLPRQHVLLFNLAVWEQGLVVAAGNPNAIRDGSDLLRRTVKVVQRERRAAAQMLLEALLQRAGANTTALAKPGLVADGHLDVARFVAAGIADVGVATRAAAMAYGMDFVPLTEERFDLAIPSHAAKTESAGRFVDALRKRTVRRELETLGGYGTARTGELVAELKPP